MVYTEVNKMSLLDTIIKPTDRPVIVTITGDAGLGKTSLAATFPSPIFIRAEDGMQSIEESIRPDAFPVIGAAGQLWEQFKALINEDHNYKTVVIDSVTALERLFIHDVLDNDPKAPKSINTALGGYGAGLSAVGAMHQRVRKAAGLLVDKGVNVVFIAHADTETIEPPDASPYTKYNLRLGKKSVAPYIDDVDMVAFLRLETFYTNIEGERAKAKSDGTRVAITYASAANVSKNRFGIEDDIIVNKGENPFKKYIKGM
jgi:hypothetical protein